MVPIFFYTALALEIIYLGLFWLTLRRPGFRFWPPPSARSWQFFAAWFVAEVVSAIFLLLGAADFNSACLPFFQRRLPFALALFGLGSAIGTWAWLTIGLRNTLGLGQRLVTRGPYRYTRNPEYIGDSLNILGYMVLTNSWMVWTVGALGLVLNILAPFTEEPWLEERFGAEYRAYKGSVPRFFLRYNILMKTQITPAISIEFDPAEQETADWIAGACREALPQIEAQWGFPPPADCRFFLMTGPLSFFFRSAPWTWKVLLAVGFPLWSGRARRTWPFSAAWTQRYGRRTAIGIKPPRLLEQSDRTIGQMIYAEEKDAQRKVRHLTCHELVHACSAQLVLPAWLNEGIATLTVEKFMQAPVFRHDTLELVRTAQPKGPPSSYRQMARQSKEVIAYQAVRGYWLVRYLEETHPGFLARIIPDRRELLAFAESAAGELGMDPGHFWEEIDGMLVDYFN